MTFVRPVNLGFCVFATLAKDSGGVEHRLLARHWCDHCFVEECSIARVLVVTGHEVEKSDSYFNNHLDWVRLANQRARTVLVNGLECSRSNLVPAIWTVPKAEWEKTKVQCLRRFGWKRQKNKRLSC